MRSASDVLSFGGRKRLRLAETINALVANLARSRDRNGCWDVPSFTIWPRASRAQMHYNAFYHMWLWAFELSLLEESWTALVLNPSVGA